MAYGTAGLTVVDVSDPTDPYYISRCATPSRSASVSLVGSYAYVAVPSNGIRIIDISNPWYPVEVGYCGTPGYAYDVTADGEYAFVADYYAGLQIYQFYEEVGVVQSPKAETMTSAYGPTIVRGVLRMIDGPSASSSSSWLLDAAGRRVMELQPGENDVSRLAPGVYFARAASGVMRDASSVERITKVVIAR